MDPGPASGRDGARRGGVVALVLLGALLAWRAGTGLPNAPTGMVHPVPLHRVDLNRAGNSELGLLPGVGPALAERIIEERAAHGPYGRVADLTRVRGIGPATMRELEPFATAEAPSPER